MRKRGALASAFTAVERRRRLRAPAAAASTTARGRRRRRCTAETPFELTEAREQLIEREQREGGAPIKSSAISNAIRG